MNKCRTNLFSNNNNNNNNNAVTGTLCHEPQYKCTAKIKGVLYVINLCVLMLDVGCDVDDNFLWVINFHSHFLILRSREQRRIIYSDQSTHQSIDTSLYPQSS